MRSASSAARSCRIAALLIVLLTAVPLAGEASDDSMVPLAAPTVVSTIPADRAVNVSLAAFIEVVFSEPMNQSTLVNVTVPAVTVTESWPSANVLRLTPVAGLAACTPYNVAVAAKDFNGTSLVAGPVPNPWKFITACASPFMVSTTPVHGDNNVPRGTKIVVTFSEPMRTFNFQMLANPTPPAAVDSWSDNDTRVTWLTTLTAGLTYTVTVVTAQDMDGNNLTPGLVPNPWSFTVNAPPDVSSPSLSAAGCLDAGTPLGISWTMSDDFTAPVDLTVTLLYTDAMGPQIITGPVAGFASSANYVWALPGIDVSTNVTIEVRDSAGGLARNWSAPFRIDTGPPRVLFTVPSNGEVDVPYESPIRITFSEAMNPSSIVIIEDPVIAGASARLLSGDMVFQIDSGMVDRKTYNITIRGTARDTCGAGYAMGADYRFSFTTGFAPPSQPGGLIYADRQETSITLTWEPVVEFATGRPIPQGTAITYFVVRDNVTIASTTATRYTDDRLRPSTNYTYRVRAQANALDSTLSAPLAVSTLPPFFTTFAGLVLLTVLGAATAIFLVAWGQTRRGRSRASANVQLQEEVRDLVQLIRMARTEPNPATRRGYEEQLQSRFLGLVAGPGDHGESIDPRLELLYRALARALIQSPEVDVAHGRSLVDARLGPLVPGFAAQGAAYRLLSEAEASVSSDLFRGLPESGRKALLLVYFYSLEEYLSRRLRVLVPPGATILLGDRGHINVRRRGWEQQWAGLSLGNLLYLLDHNRRMFLADEDRWEEDVEPFVHQTVDARNRTAHPSREAPPLDRVRELIYTSFRLLESVLKAPKGAAAVAVRPSP